MTSGSYQSRPSMLHWTQWYSAMVPWTCFHCSPFRWHPNFQSVIITQPSMFDFVCVLFPIFRYHNESPTHFDSIIENALPWVMGHSKWPIAYPDPRYGNPMYLYSAHCKNCDYEPISGFTACCQRCDRPVVINTTPPDHRPASCDTYCW